MKTTTKVGIIGCGLISDAYFSGAKKYRAIEIIACADVFPERARAKEELYGAKAMSVKELLSHPEVEIVVNLTPPKYHTEIDLAVLESGKHVYSEKPFGVNMDDARKVMECAAQKGLRIGCAPDTFLGSSMQTARKAIDDNWIGRPLSGTAIVAGRGPEKWGNAPFFYDEGAGPMLDLGPYYCTALVNLLGPARSVTAVTAKGFDYRTFADKVVEPYNAKYHPYDKYPVNVNTHQTGIIEFQNGAIITMVASFDVYRNNHNPIEIYGSEGSMIVPDPNKFTGEVKVYRREWPNVYESPSWMVIPAAFGNADPSRSIGAADMAAALKNNRPHRCSGELACHVLEIMLAFDKSSALGGKVMLETSCRRPEPLPMGLEPGEIPMN